MAQTASYSGEQLEADRLRSLSSGKTRDPVYTHVRDTLLACDTKQNAARSCIRFLDDNGKAAPARLYFVGDDPNVITRYQGAMFPGSAPLQILMDEEPAETASGPEKLAYLLATSEGELLESSEVLEYTGIDGRKIVKALRSPKVTPILAAQGWRKAPRKSVGLEGKGWILRRNSP